MKKKLKAHEVLQDFPDIKWKWWRYRWEFMRRDPEYLEAYQTALELRKEAGLTPDDTIETVSSIGVRVITFPYFETSPGDRERQLAFQFFGKNPAAAYILDPGKTLAELFPERRDRLLFLGGDKEKAVQLYRQMPKRVPRETILLTIDISKANSKDSLKKYLAAIVDSFFLQFGQDKTEKMKTFELLLKVGDLHRQGMKPKEISRLLFSDTDNPDENQRRARRAYYRMINGGWRKLTYP